MGSDSAGSRRAVAALLAASVLVGAPAARAQRPSAADRETARSLMDLGDDRMEARDYLGALKAYRGADAIMHLPMTTIAVAEAEAALGHILEARDIAITVMQQPKQAGETPAYAQARNKAAALADSLAPRIPSIRVSVDGGSADVQVAIDGAILPSAAATLPRKVDPGKHLVVVTAPGFQAGSREVTVKERESAVVALSLKPARGAEPSPSEGQAPTPDEPERPAGPRHISPLAYVGFGVGAAGIAAGAVTGILSLARTSRLKGACPQNTCPASAHSDYAAATTLANASNVSFAVGVVGVGAGVVALLLSGQSGGGAPHGASGGRVRISPVAGPGYAAIAGVF